MYEAESKAASFFSHHPRHDQLISINKKYNYFSEDEFNLQHDWNFLLSDDLQMRFTEYSDDLYPIPADLCKYLNDFAEKFKLNINYNTRVTCIGKDGNGIFNVTTQDAGEAKCSTARCVLMATGAVEENLPDTIEGKIFDCLYTDLVLEMKLVYVDCKGIDADNELELHWCRSLIDLLRSTIDNK